MACNHKSVRIEGRRLFLATCLGATLTAALCTGASAAETSLRWFTTASTSTNHVAALQLAKTIGQKDPSLNVSVHDSTGALENMRRLVDGSADLVNMTTDLAYNARHGVGNYEGKAFPKIRSLLTTGVLTYSIIARADAGITTLEDLNGKKFSPGFTGTSTMVAVMRELDVLGIKPDYVPLSLRDAISAMKDGRILGFAKGAAVPDASILEIASGGPIRLLQPTRAQLDEAVSKIGGTIAFTQTITKGLYAGIDEDLEYSQLGFGLFVGTSSDLPQAVGYALAKNAIEHWDEALLGVKGFKNADPVKLTVSSATVPLAAGAVQYLKERGVDVPDRLVPPEYKP